MQMLNDNLASVRAAELAEKNARKAARVAEINALKAQLAQSPQWDETDPWDYRNFTRKKFWTTPLTNAQIPRFLANTVNTPTALDVSLDVFQISKKGKNQAKTLEHIINGVDEFAHPWKIVRGAAKTHEFKLLVKTLGSAVLKHLGADIKTGVKDKTITTITDPNGGFAPRQIFPNYNS